jgi:hypothetical protein
LRTFQGFVLTTLLLALSISPALGEVVRGGATLGSVSAVVKISRERNGLESLVEGEVLYIFTETGEAVSQIVVKDVFSDEVHSEPLPSAVARQIRETGVILIFSNLREYGDYISATLTGTADSFREFMADHPRSELGEEVKRILDGLVYRPYKLRGTVEAFEEFLQKYPDTTYNSYAVNALKRRDDLQYAVASIPDKISGYRKFILTYPDNIHTPDARERLTRLQEGYEEITLEDLARYPRSNNGKTIKFPCTLHSALPVYVEGPGVGRKTAAFQSPRNSFEHLNFQVGNNGYVLWRLFASRGDDQLVRMIEGMDKGTPLRIYGTVFDTLGGAPWIDVDDIEKL